MENKTISYLNSKAWYRLLKVIYGAIFILICIGLLVGIFQEVGSYQEDYRVSCNYGNKKSFFAAKDENIYISTYYGDNNSLAELPDYTKKELQSACGISSEEISKLINQAKNGNSDDKKLFDISKEKINVTTYWMAIWWSILSLAGVCIVFEIVKRVFYYITLGAIRPKK